MKKRKEMVLALAAVMAVASITACGNTQTGDNEGDFTGKTLNIMTWEGDVSDTVVAAFEEEYGCTVNVNYMEDTNTLLSKVMMGNSEYDLIDIESAYVSAFVEAGVLAELDYDLLTNLENVDETLLEIGAAGDEKFVYTLPSGGPYATLVVYNKETCPITINSFKDLADPALKGEIFCTNATISLYEGGLRALGYDINSDDPDELAEAQELLYQIKDNVKVFGPSCLSALETGECSVAYTWDYNMLMIDGEENWDKFEIVDDTANLYNQNWGITKSSANKELAMTFLNYTMDPKNNGTLCNEWGGIPLCKRELVEEYLPEGYYDNPYITKYLELWPNHTNLCVTDSQVDQMDVLYTELMTDQ